MSKKKKEKKVKNYSSDSEEMYRMLKIFAAVVVVLVAFYLVFAIARGEISFGGKKREEKDPVIQDKIILAGNIYSRSESEYYVLMYDFKSDDAKIYDNIYSIHSSDSNNKKMYLVDLSREVDKQYVVDDKSKVNVSSIENLKVADGTLIYVKDGKGASLAVGVEEIKKVLLNK